jgi:flavin-dependent dehydrogenase
VSRAGRVEVAVVGGGPAGAIVAALLARRGREVLLLERSPAWRWHACGVFTSPVTVAALRDVGLPAAVLEAAARPTPAMRVETPGGAAFRLAYGDDGSLAAPAVGFDRRRLDEALLDLAAAAGAEIRRGSRVRHVDLAAGAGAQHRLAVDGPAGEGSVDASVVVGADGAHSVLARAAGVQAWAPFSDRVGLTFHIPDPDPAPHDARMVVADGAYVGLAPVPDDRINVGIVLTGQRRRQVREEGAERTAAALLGEIGVQFEPCDAIAGAAPLAHRVSRRAGDGWLLIGDAAGFLDPFTGEGLHRAIVSARLAAAAIDRHLAGARGALGAYERSMTRRFATKDVVTAVVQAFLARPALFEYAARRLGARDGVRETMGLVMGDLAPASRALDPRFLAALLRP